MNSERHAEFLRFRKQHVMIGMRMRFARHHKWRNPSAFASILDRAFELVRRTFRVAERQMRNRDEPAAAVLAEIDHPSVVSARERLSEFDILAFGLVEQAQGRVDEGGFKAFRLDSGQPFFWIHRPEGSGNSIPGSLMPSALARRAHRAESRQSGAIKDFREPAADFEMLLAAIVLAYPHRAGFVFGLDVTTPQCRVFQHVAVRVNRALV